MEQIVIENFRNPANGQAIGLHRLVKGFVPHYRFLASENDDSNFRQKISPDFPLVLSPALTTVRSKASRRLAIMVENGDGSALTDGSGKKVLYALDDWNVFFDDSAQIDYGTPASVTANDGVDLAFFAGKVVTTHYGSAKLKSKSGVIANSWDNHTGTPTNFTTSVLKLMRLFSNQLLVADSNKIYSVTSGFVSSLAFTFSIGGVAQTIIDYNNLRDQYMILFFEYTGGFSSPLTKKTDFVIWDGVNSTNYDFRGFFKGKFIASVVRDNTVYAFSQVGTDLVCWKFTGPGFQEVGRLHNIIASTSLSNPKMRVSSEKDFFVLLAKSYGNVTVNSPLYWNPFTGDNFFLMEQTNETLGLLISESTDGIYQRYFSYVDGSSNGLLQQTTFEASSRFDTAVYKSGVIPIPISKGIHRHMGRGQIKFIEVEFNKIPQAVTDVLTLVLTSKDEYLNETYNTDTATIKNTTANSTSVRVDTKRAFCDIGRFCTEFEFSLSVSKTTAAYDLIIRRFIINYEPIKLQQ